MSKNKLLNLSSVNNFPSLLDFSVFFDDIATLYMLEINIHPKPHSVCDNQCGHKL